MSSQPTRGPAARSLLALDALNVFLADVRDGLGPYLGIYLLTRGGWNEGRIGVAMAAMGIATVAAQTPAGALIDRVRHKRTLVALAAVVVALGAVVMVAWPTFPVILGAQVAIGAAAAIFPPAIAALSLGLVGHARLAGRMGRNEAFNHAGNVAAAILAALIGDGIAIEGIFYLLAGMALATVAATWLIRSADIDDDLARGATDTGGAAPHIVGLRTLVTDRRIVTFALAVTLFHFANAAMLPFAGQKLAHVQQLATGGSDGVATCMSACIIAAQLVMIPVAIWSSRRADSWGRKPVLLVGFAVLPVRGLLYTLTADRVALVAIQLLDGIGAGILGVVVVLVVADLTRGTGRFNLVQGALATATGLGAALSNLMTGYVVQAWGFDAGFLVLAVIALGALLFFALAMPETGATADRVEPAEGWAPSAPPGPKSLSALELPGLEADQ